ncbi:putative membrane protein [Peptoniphilus sp. ING2-D1G]|nr:putative membrane protein [Peptoniphilus sp. ING2-D1G]
MIPGGLGSFDLMALTSFTAMGLESEKVLSWLMLFRLFYYIIPFFIGMALLSNVGINENSFVQEKLAFLIYTFSDKFYSFKGLRNYKQKFASDWQPVYVSFSRKSWLLYTLISIFFADILAVKEHKN